MERDGAQSVNEAQAVKRVRTRRRIRLVATLGALALAGGLSAIALSAQPPRPPSGKPAKTYSPYADRKAPVRVYWGDLHLHTSFSPDAGLVGDKLGPDQAYRFARGEQLQSSSGQPVKLERPLDWVVVSDHAEYHGLPQAFEAKDPDILGTPTGRRWAEDLQKGGQAGYQAFVEMTKEFAEAKPSITHDALAKMYRTSWDGVIDAAERNNKPGTFSAFVGFEWTQSLEGNNLHRTVIFRDGADRTKQVLPFSEFDSTNTEDLWKYMVGYEQKTGGRVLSVAHNPNLSAGLMFAPKTESGKPFDKNYAALRSRFDRLTEATQSKGDSETTPQLSPTDPFADFERWNKANIFGMVATTPEMLPYNYVRSALKLGLELQSKLGINPFQYGMIGGSDNHTSLPTTRAENYFGVGTISEPKAGRWNEYFLKSPVSSRLDTKMWEMAPGGLGGVWARENTREAIWDALYRKEVYATSGTRPTVRVFGGFDFTEKDLASPEPAWVDLGYARGVPMGGVLSNAPKGKVPGFMVKATYDPDGAYLDRVQIIKGWLDAKGAQHEKVIDVVWSGDRKPDPTTGTVPLVGNTVDIKNATWTNTIGAPQLIGFWRDPDFDRAQRAFYYVRLIEIPTPRWTAYDAKRFGTTMDPQVPMTVTNRAYTSPIWYTPAMR